MELKHTKKILEEKTANKDMESYAVFVSMNGEEALITSLDVDENTYFDVASVGKVLVTSPLVLQAISRGMLSLESTLSDYFENVPAEKRQITIKQLLTHTSGIVRNPLPAEIAARNNNVIAAQILSFDLAFAPGSNYQYSCSGMMLLGFILEKIYDQTLDEIFFEQIKHPLKLGRTRFNIAIDEENSVVSYERENVGLRRMDDWTVVLMRNGVSGAGGSFWSISAVQRFVQAILEKSDVLYSEEMYELAEQNHTPHLSEKRGLGYGLDGMKGDIKISPLFPEGSFGHNGWAGNTIFVNREKNMYVIILSNTRRCMVRKYPGTSAYNSEGKDMVYLALADIFNAIKVDLDQEGLY